MKSRVGTQWYASPELLQRQDHYNEKIDVWGLGLILYIMLSGAHPFEGFDMYSNVTCARLSFKEASWAQVSPLAREIIAKCLRAQPSERLTAAAIMEDAWLVEGLKHDRELSTALAYLRRFQVRHVQEIAMKVLALKLTPAEHAEVRAVFDSLDTDKKGFLGASELRDALTSRLHSLGASEKYNVPSLLRKVIARAQLQVSEAGLAAAPAPMVDTPVSAESAEAVLPRAATPPLDGELNAVMAVTFEQFLAVALEEDDELIRRHLVAVFEAMDVDGSGTVSAADLQTTLAHFADESALTITEADVATMISEFDMDGSGALNYAGAHTADAPVLRTPPARAASSSCMPTVSLSASTTPASSLVRTQSSCR